MLDLGRIVSGGGDDEPPAPDPCILPDGRLHLLYATTNFGSQQEADGQPLFRARASLDRAQTFHPLSVREVATNRVRPASIFPSRDDHPWASHSTDWWAPEVWKVWVQKSVSLGGCLTVRSEPKYLALYSARKDDGELAVGCALGDRPWEHFKDLGKPFIENDDEDGRGVIDGTYAPFLSAVSWKKDGNHVVMVDGQPTQVPTPIYLQKIRVLEDDVVREGPIKTVMINDQDWEGDLVEGPAFWKHGGRTFCFYSANCYLDERYAMGYAYTDDDPFADDCTWTKHQGPFISSASDFIRDAELAGPGHCMVYPIPGTTDIEMVFHAWPKEALKTAREREARAPHVVRLTFADGFPQVVPGTLRAI